MSTAKNHEALEEQLVKKYARRERKKAAKMKVSGRSTLALQKIISSKSKAKH
jgi:hypothetical protein